MSPNRWEIIQLPSSRWWRLRAALEIASAKILILDEPTSSLDVNETNRLFDVMRKLKSEGIGIIFITHFLDQVYQISDRITVLRNGKLVGTYDTASLPRIELIAKMLGRSLTDLDADVKSQNHRRTKAGEGTPARSQRAGRATGSARTV